MIGLPNEIRVHTVYKHRRCTSIRWPASRSRNRPARVTVEKQIRSAAKWETDLQEGRDKAPSKIIWDDFRRRYEDEVCDSFAESTNKKLCSMFNAAERRIAPKRLTDLTAAEISRFQLCLRNLKRSENTIEAIWPT